MAPSPSASKRKRGRGADPAAMRAALLDAAFASLIEDGYRNTSARSIAARADCNQAAIYYHFGGIEELLVASLRRSSDERLDRYREELDGVDTVSELLERIHALYLDDRTSGHLAALTELVGGVTANPDLRSGVSDVTEPWIEFMRAKISDVAASSPALSIVAPDDVGDLLLSIVFGLELRNKLDGRDDRADRLFTIARSVAALFDVGTSPG